jgi:hypothetical protein
MEMPIASSLLTAILGLGAILSLGLAWEESAIVRVEAAAAATEPPAGTCRDGCPARTRLALARIATERAAREPSAPRVNPELDAVLAARPAWPNALVERAYWLSARQPGSPQEAQALADSYRAAPYFRAVALWRVGTVARSWRTMPPGVRDRAATEARWYMDIDAPSRDAMTAVIAGSPIEVALLARAAAR